MPRPSTALRSFCKTLGHPLARVCKSVATATHPPSLRSASSPPHFVRGRKKALRRQGLLHGGDELLEGERLGQEGVLAVLGQVFLERVLGVAGDEDDF